MVKETEPDLGDTRNNNSSTKLLEIETQEEQLKTDFYVKPNSETERLTLNKLSKSPDRPLQYLVKTEEHIKEKREFLEQLTKGTEKVMFPEGAGFCELASSSFCSPFLQKKRVGDGDCSAKKSEGCAIYQRYQAIKKYYPNDQEALKILRLSDENSPIKRRD